MKKWRLEQSPSRQLYTSAERARRDATIWTLVQGILAPVQFIVLRYLSTGDGFWVASLSIVTKTAILYLIMITGSIWEKVVFGKYLFAPAFFWEDVFSMAVLALHTTYLIALFTGWLTPEQQMFLALAAYATYVINAAQFLLKLRRARLDQAKADDLAEPAIMVEYAQLATQAARTA
jgi:3-vinyl bacteriochlorophyllide hydratase